jgi:hypothetical protein
VFCIFSTFIDKKNAHVVYVAGVTQKISNYKQFPDNCSSLNEE